MLKAIFIGSSPGLWPDKRTSGLRLRRRALRGRPEAPHGRHLRLAASGGRRAGRPVVRPPERAVVEPAAAAVPDLVAVDV